MRLLRNISLAILLMAAGSQTLKAQNIKEPKGYLFGFVASFNDSTVYFTDIQEMDTSQYIVVHYPLFFSDFFLNPIVAVLLNLNS